MARVRIIRCMMRWGLALSAIVGLAGAGTAATLPRADDPRHLTPADRQAMLVLVRRLAAGGPVAFDPDTMPAKLQRSTGRPVLVSAHRAGVEPLIVCAAKGTLFEQLTQATQQLRETGRLADLGAVRFKLDVAETLERAKGGLLFGLGGPRTLGIHGIHLRAGEREVWLPPSEGLWLGLRSEQGLVRHALGRLAVPAADQPKVILERFRVASFIERQPGGGGTPVDLYRGLPLVGRVTRRQLVAAVEAAGGYLLRMQKPDGSFHYIYDPLTDKVEDGYNVVHHAGVAWGLVQAHQATGQRRFLDGGRRALDWLAARLKTRDDLGWVDHEGRRALGAAALAVVGTLDYRAASQDERFDAAAQRLGRFVLFMQRPDGFFHSEYDPAKHAGFWPEDRLSLYAPGEAMVALARLARALPDARWRQALVRAADFAATKRDAWLATRGLEAIFPDAWTIQALDELHALGAAKRRHVDYAFFLARIALGEQLGPGDTPWLDHVGAPRTPGQTPTVIACAARCEGYLAAWRLARRMGVAETAYRRATLLAVRFQLRHQFDGVNGYLLRNPARARGGVFASTANLRVRIDAVQHHLAACWGAARLLRLEEEK